MNQQEERNCVAVSCSSCFLKLSMLQKQTEKIENMLFCIKKTLNFKEACLYMGLSKASCTNLPRTGISLTTDRPANCYILTSRNWTNGSAETRWKKPKKQSKGDAGQHE